MSIQSLLIQVAFLYAPFVHSPTQEVMPNIFRGHDPKIQEIMALHDKGFKTIVSLRTNPESKKRRYCDKLGMKWIQIRTGVFLTPTDEQFDQFRAIVKNPANLPCYVSCEIDMDRTSVY